MLHCGLAAQYDGMCEQSARLNETKQSRPEVAGRVVFITGGSEGVGKAQGFAPTKIVACPALPCTHARVLAYIPACI